DRNVTGVQTCALPILLNGGKRLRPFLVMEGAALFSADGEAALRIAAALECVHCYSLIHDDLPAMDDDDLRRGQPTVHKAFDEAKIGRASCRERGEWEG